MELRIVVTTDSAEYDYGEAIKRDLEQDERVDEIIDVGVKDGEKTSCLHIDIAGTRLIAGGKADRGVSCCGTGTSVAISANKVPGVRANAAHNSFSVGRLILLSDAHVLCLGQRVIGLELARRLAREFPGYEFNPSSHSKANVDVLVEYENDSAGY